MPPEPFQFEYRTEIAGNHPASDGHFAGNPIIPGALILEHVRIAFGKFRSDMYLRQIVKVKNLYALKPGKALTVKIRAVGSQGSYSFVCLDCDENEIAVGDFRAARHAELAEAAAG